MSLIPSPFGGASSSSGSSSSSVAPSACFLLPILTDNGGSLLEILTPNGGTIASFGVTSTVKGGAHGNSVGGGGKIDLITAFGGFAVATFTDSNRLVIYSLTTQAKHNQSTLPERARALLVDSACRYLIIGSGSGRLRIYALASGSLVADVKTPHDRGINVLAMDRACRWLVVGGEDGIVSVYDFGALLSGGNGATGGNRSGASSTASTLVLSISDHTLAITALQVSASNMLLTASKDGSVRLYQLEQPISLESSSTTITSSASGAPSPACLFHQSFRGVIHAAILDSTESIVYVAVKENIHWFSLYAPSHHPPCTWRGHSSHIVSLVSDASSAHLLSLDAEGTTKIWEGGVLAPGSLPSAQGTCLKTLIGRRGTGVSPTGAPRQVVCLDGPKTSIGKLATVNLLAAQQPSHKSSSSTGLQGKEGTWIFPPLNSSQVASATAQSTSGVTLFVPVSMTPHLALNSEVDHYSHRTSSHRSKRRWSTRVESELNPSLDSQRDWRRSDRMLLSGESGWSTLAESAAARGNNMDLLQNQSETYQQHANQLYQLCLDKIWSEMKG